MKRFQMMMLLAAAGTTCTVSAQDSTAATGSTDALDVYNTTAQVVEYVVDMDTFFSSKGKSYGIAPVLKASAEASGMFPTNLISSNGLSRLRGNSPAGNLNGPYTLWSTAGAGVNGQANSGSTTTVNAPGDTVYLGAGFSEFNGLVNNIITAQIGYSPADPDRLFVSRVVAAVNSSTNGASDSSQLAFGSIDEAGFLHLRADDFGLSGPNQISGNNILRVDTGSRNPAALNVINSTGGTDATTDILRGSGTVHSPPSAVPTAQGGPAYFGPTAFSNSEMRHETSGGGTTTTTIHRGAAPDHRGTIGVYPDAFVAPGDAVTAGILAKDGSDNTTAISVWGADDNGQPTAAGVRYISPDTITDPVESVDLFPNEFIHTSGNSAFRGNVAQVAVGTNLDGDLLIAATSVLQLSAGSRGGASQSSEITGILVGRVSTPGGAADWSIASWLNPNSGTGKELTDENGVPFAQLANRNAIPGAGPGTTSAPAMDSAGNIYFVQPVRLYGDDGQPFTADDFVTTSVLRANYIDDADGNGNFGYDLEQLFDFGSTFDSAGTGLQYRITFLTASTGSGLIQNSTIHSGAVTSQARAGSAVNDATDAETLGGLIVQAEITYDVDADGEFDSALGTDQDYQVVLFVHPVEGTQVLDCNENGVPDADDIANGTSNDFNQDGVPDECQLTRLCADVNGNGVVDGSDFFAWVQAFGAGALNGDVNNDGVTNGSDFFAWVANFNLGQNGPLCPEY